MTLESEKQNQFKVIYFYVNKKLKIIIENSIIK